MKHLGIGLIILSTVLYAGLFGVPFLHLALKTKAIISTGLVISGEASFWIGALLVGKELARKYRNYLNPLNWFKKKANEGEAAAEKEEL